MLEDRTLFQLTFAIEKFEKKLNIKKVSHSIAKISFIYVTKQFKGRFYDARRITKCIFNDYEPKNVLKIHVLQFSLIFIKYIYNNAMIYLKFYISCLTQFISHYY